MSKRKTNPKTNGEKCHKESRERHRDTLLGIEGYDEKTIADFLLSVKFGGSPLVSEALTVNILAGITGSASGGMSIALGAMAKPWLEWAAQVNLDPQMLHRIASLACGGLDSLPHNGAVITLLAVCGLTHKESYIDIGVTTVFITVMMSFVMILFHAITGLV